MRMFNTPSRLVLICGVVVLASNAVTGIVTAHVTRSHDYSELNRNCLLNWGAINARFDDRPTYDLQQDPAQLYRIYEKNALFAARYPSRQNADDGALSLFCWGVAADDYHWKGKDIALDPTIWKSFLTEGPKDLPIYWDVRKSLTREGAGQGLIRGDTPPWLKPVPTALRTGAASGPTTAATDASAPSSLRRD